MTGHAHRWRLEEPNGTRYVTGRCVHCGAERHDFSVADPFDYDASAYPAIIPTKGRKLAGPGGLS